MEYFNDGIPENPNIPKEMISPLFKPLNMTKEERAALLEFLENGLYDPNVMRYRPDATMSGNCFPNNDLQSQIDMGCQ